MSELIRGGVRSVAPVYHEIASEFSTDHRSISFWTSGEGQDLIERFDGQRDSTNLSTWLAQSRPRLYGSEAGLNNLWGLKNLGVAAFAQAIEIMYGPDSEAARTLAAALEDYARLA